MVAITPEEPFLWARPRADAEGGAALSSFLPCPLRAFLSLPPFTDEKTEAC